VQDLVSRIPTDVFWTAVVAFVLGVACAYRFARTIEAARLALRRAGHHYQAALDDWGRAMRGGALVVAAVFGILLLGGGVVFLVAMKITA
jgi:hypothetical protein